MPDTATPEVTRAVGNHTNTITINGKIYDTRTGSLLQAATDIITPTFSPRQVVDGVIRKPRGDSPAEAAVAQKSTTKPHNRHSVTAHHVHRKPERAHILMRKGVKKPLHVKASKANSPIIPKTIEPVVSPKSLAKAERVRRATSVPRSHLVSRFTVTGEHSSVIKKTAPLSVKAAPDGALSQHANAPLPTSIPTLPIHHDFFAHALHNATSHQTAAPKRATRRQRTAKRLRLSSRALNVSAVIMVIVVLSGFVAYQNSARIALRVASARSGVQASLPGYTPAGFHLSRTVQASPGSITINFRSNSDQRDFRIIQQTSNWNSDTLLNSFVASSNQPYQQVSTDRGQTVYLYGDNATWVDGGIWYRVEGNSALSSTQLLNLAASF